MWSGARRHDHQRQFAALGHEDQRDGIHAVPRALERVALAEENVAEVAMAVPAEDLGAPAVGICLAPHGAADLVVETGPTAPGVELVGRTVEGRVAPLTEVGTGQRVVLEFAGERALGAFLQDDVLLRGGQFVVLHRGLLVGLGSGKRRRGQRQGDTGEKKTSHRSTSRLPGTHHKLYKFHPFSRVPIPAVLKFLQIPSNIPLDRYPLPSPA